VPLVRQTWLCNKKDRYVALQMLAIRERKRLESLRVRFEVVEAKTEKGLDFDPAGFSKAGNATCPFCGTVANNDYVKEEGKAGRMGMQSMAVVSTRPGPRGKVYLAADGLDPQLLPDHDAIRPRIAVLCERTGITVPEERLVTDAKNSCWCMLYGLTKFTDLFAPRQILALLSFATAVRECIRALERQGVEIERAKAVETYLAVLVNRQADYNSSLARWHVTRELITGTFGRQALPMVWDFVELAPFGGASGSPYGALDWIVAVAEAQSGISQSATVSRGSATALPLSDFIKK
jgi:putative DNA methylase